MSAATRVASPWAGRWGSEREGKAQPSPGASPSVGLGPRGQRRKQSESQGSKRQGQEPPGVPRGWALCRFLKER